MGYRLMRWWPKDGAKHGLVEVEAAPSYYVLVISPLLLITTASLSNKRKGASLNALLIPLLFLLPPPHPLINLKPKLEAAHSRPEVCEQITPNAHMELSVGDHQEHEESRWCQFIASVFDTELDGQSRPTCSSSSSSSSSGSSTMIRMVW